MADYHDGRRVEYVVMRNLRANGYDCTRAASSKGICDVFALKAGQALFVSVKRTDPLLPPAERVALIRAADCLPGAALPLVAYKPKGEPLRYRQLTGPGPKDWTPWTPDPLGA